MTHDRTADFSLHFTDADLNTLIRNSKEAPRKFTRHFNTAEDFFIRLEEPVTIPSFAIHHDVHTSRPSQEYMRGLWAFIRGLLPQIGSLFAETSWYFDPRDIFHPGFYQLYDVKGRKYLFVLKMDLGIQPRGCEVLEEGTNDRTPVYKTRDLYLDAEILPLESEPENRKEFWIHRYFNPTWTGEHGRGYFVQGVWIDDSLSKFLSKVFMPAGKKVYPFYPFRCRYNTISTTVVDFSTAGRHRSIKLLDRVLDDLTAHLPMIQKTLQNQDFSENLEFFLTLRKQFEPHWSPVWKHTRIESYLNQDEQKEYTYHDEN